MRRALGMAGLLALAAGLALGTAGTVAGQNGQAGYDDTQVAGAQEELPRGVEVYDVAFGEDEAFEQTIEPGSFLDLTADGFAPDSKGTIEIASERQILAFVTADEDGVVHQRVEIPADVELGDHTLYVVGIGEDGEPREISMGIEIGFPDEGSNWPAWTAGSIALALAVIGVVRWRSVRSRDRQFQAS